jgi:Transglycosylase SLT domain
MLKEAGTFFAIVMLILVGAYVYISSLGGLTGSGLHLGGFSVTHQPSGNTSYQDLARQDATQAGIPPDRFVRQIQVESGFRPGVVSPAGAIGIAQILPTTARAWNVNPWDAAASLSTAAQHMGWYERTYGSYAKALSCYNAGCERLVWAEHHCADYYYCLPTETQRYISAVMED